MDPEDKHLTAFSTTTLSFRPYAAWFEECSHHFPETYEPTYLLLGLQDSELLVYLDDFIVFAADLEGHEIRLFERLLNLSYLYGQISVNFSRLKSTTSDTLSANMESHHGRKNVERSTLQPSKNPDTCKSLPWSGQVLSMLHSRVLR